MRKFAVRSLAAGLALATYIALCGFFFIFPIPKSDDRRVSEMSRARDWHGVVNYTTEKIKSDPKNDSMLNFRCLANINLKRLDEAEQDCQDSLKAAPDNHSPTNNLGLIRLRRGQNTEALPYFRKAVQLKPDFGIGWSNLVMTYRAMGEPGKAWDAYQQLAKVDESRAKQVKTAYLIPDQRPADPPPASTASMPSQSPPAGDKPAAEGDRSASEPASPVAARTPEPTVANLSSGTSSESDIQASQRLVLAEPTNAPAWQTLARQYGMRGEDEKAVRAYGEALKLNPADLDSLEAVGALHAKLGQQDKVKEIWETIAKLDKARAEKFFGSYILP